MSGQNVIEVRNVGKTFKVYFDKGSMLKEKCCPTIRSSRRTCPVRCGSRPTNKCCRPTRRPYIFVSKWSMQRGVPCGSATTKSRAKSPGPRDCWGSKNANNSDMTDYTDNRHRAYHGRLLAYVRTTGEAGDITVRFTSPLLKGCRINLRAK